MKFLLFLAIAFCAGYRLDARGAFAIEHHVADCLLEQLYDINGDYKLPRPELQISPSDKYGGAAYRPVSNTLVLEYKAYQVCRSFGPDSLHALAFIIGHELTHFYQSRIQNALFETQFLAYDQHYPGTIRQEKTADIQGAFTAYLAGYRPERVLDEFFDRLYVAYGIGQQPSKRYPTLEKRRQTAKEMWVVVEDLIQIFESAPYLLVLGEHRFAIAGFGYIAAYYQGREIQNNLGVSYALEAINFSEKSVDKYLYPLEIDVESRLIKPQARGGSSELSPDQRSYRQRLLASAKTTFEEILAKDYSYFTADVNLLCVLTFMGEYGKAIDYYEFKNLEKKHRQLKLPKIALQEAQLAYAIALIQTQNTSYKNKGRSLLSDLIRSELPNVAHLARQNLRIMDQGSTALSSSEVNVNCSLPFDPTEKVDGVLINRYKYQLGTWIDPDKGISIFQKKHENSVVVNYYQEGGHSISIQRVYKPKSYSKNITLSEVDVMNRGQLLPATNGIFLPCPGKHVICKTNDHCQLEEWAKYYR